MGHDERTHFDGKFDKMIPRHVFQRPFTVGFYDRSEWERDSTLRNGDSSGTEMDRRHMKALELGCMAMA
jgi:hypothetical protein